MATRLAEVHGREALHLPRLRQLRRPCAGLALRLRPGSHNTQQAFASIGELFLFWISLIDEGYMYWDAPSWYISTQLPEDIANKLGGVPSD